MSGYHRLRPVDLDALAAGPGSADLVRTLRAGQVSKRMLLLRAVLDLADPARTSAYFALLTAAVRHDPAVGPELLALPHTGAWLTVTLRRLRQRRERPPVPAASGRTTAGLKPPAEADHPAEVDLGHLGALAATAAIRAGLDFELTLPAPEGEVFLPSLGRARCGGVDPVTVSRSGGRVRVGSVEVPTPDGDLPAGAGVDRDGWSGLHRLTSSADGLTVALWLDDLDPYRDCHRLCATGRLDAAVVGRWQRLLDDAWPILVRHHRLHAEAISEGLRIVVPLQADSASAGVNVTSMDAFGAVSMTPPADGAALALGLLHEFQHAKLGAAIDIEPLQEAEDRRYYYAPWRDDPRPLGAALHGVYAFVAVTEFWRTRRRVLPPGRSRLAEVEFARWRDRVARTCADIRAYGRLTVAGRRFVAGLGEVIDGWRDEAVPAEAAALAREAADDHWTVWRLRNRRPEARLVRRLAEAWRMGAACPAITVPVAVRPADGRWLSRSPRLDLVRLRLADPARFERLRSGIERLADVLPEASAGDLALAAGDHLTARAWYQRQLRQQPDQVAAWVGLTLADGRLPTGEAAMRADPELCRAVLCTVAETTAAPDPLELSRWLAPVTCVPAADEPPPDGSAPSGRSPGEPSPGVAPGTVRQGGPQAVGPAPVRSVAAQDRS
ncbi:HEXXH motif-containing putative peptide modification protein [Verrucosispora sp. WMMD573]|uniref:HEXXH motif domain-containing protein n=1 Tax=Verrucosispora sp. WMMD573 TaxID=3015149 RepID=UPI00248D06B8|nr:HEXXH motif-containing putative peptide modification protein [Verrucosispora sp. WMMD573]WBB56674.1 HEXXH motif-containing putative peptide modification protein [Verrucosispora sp. WMMD573]